MAITSRQHHGVVSLLLICAALMIGVYAVWQISVAMMWFYLAIILISSIGIVYCYCNRCSVRSTSCGHIIPGLLTRFFPERGQGRYSFADYLITVVSFIALVGFPQYWLWERKSLFFAFWTFLGVAVIVIRFFVCVACGNEKCPLCTKYSCIG